MRLYSRILFLLLLLAAPLTGFAKETTYIREYTYNASEMDSAATARHLAIQQAKALLLEEVGSRVFTASEIDSKHNTETGKGGTVYRNRIRSLSAGMVKTRVLADRWDGKTYWCKLQMRVDEDKLVDALNHMSPGELEARTTPRPPQANPQPSHSSPPRVPRSPPLGQLPPESQRYMQLARTSSVMAGLQPVKVRALQFYQMEGRWPGSLKDLGFKASEMNDGELIDAVSIGREGAITAVLNSKSFGQSKTLTLKPRFVMGGTNIRWDCTTNMPDEIFRMPSAGNMRCKGTR